MRYCEGFSYRAGVNPTPWKKIGRLGDASPPAERPRGAAQGRGLALMNFWNHSPEGSMTSCMVFLSRWVRPKLAA